MDIWFKVWANSASAYLENEKGSYDNYCVGGYGRKDKISNKVIWENMGLLERCVKQDFGGFDTSEWVTGIY